MTVRNRELVPDNWSLVRERALTTGLCSRGWYSEHLGVCGRAELPGRSLKAKKFWKVDGNLMRNDLKAKQRQLYSIFCSIGSQWRERSIGVTWANLDDLKKSLAILPSSSNIADHILESQELSSSHSSAYLTFVNSMHLLWPMTDLITRVHHHSAMYIKAQPRIRICQTAGFIN